MRFILTNEDPPQRILPPQIVLGVIRAALIVTSLIVLVITARVNSYARLPDGWHRVPFLFVSLIACVWALFVTRVRVVQVCSIALALLFLGRALDLALYGPSIVRVVGAATWAMLSVWCYLMGIINQVTISQKKAGELWGFLAPPKS